MAILLRYAGIDCENILNKMFLTNISFCAQHTKGYGPPIPDELHAKWLWECVEYWHKSYEKSALESAFPFNKIADIADIAVSVTGIQGITDVRAGAERDYWWKVWNHARIIFSSNNPGHQQGCCVGIRMGLEAAAKCGIPYMIHTAEDVIPHHGAVDALKSKILEGYDYAGMPWGYHDEYLNAQFFACRVDAIVARFDPGVVHGDQHSEKYLKELFDGKKVWTGPLCYSHSHDYNEWKGFLEKAKQ